MDSHSSGTPTIKCAQCGEQLVVPEWSEYVDEYRVRHVWKCEPCGYYFEATIATRRRGAGPHESDAGDTCGCANAEVHQREWQTR